MLKEKKRMPTSKRKS